MDHQINGIALPNEAGFFGKYGGQFIPPHLKAAMDDIKVAYEQIRVTEEFQTELAELFAHYVGRPSPLFYAKRLSEQLGGAQIYLKREDLNHTGAHKINHCLGEALLAKYMGKTKVIAETGAGQHGVALATACALVGIPCEIHMGQVDIEKEHPNVVKMKILGATLISVTRGTATLKDAVDSAFEEYLKDPTNYIYAIGSVVGPHPFPMMVRDFQSVISKEAREQIIEYEGKLPTAVMACVGGGSNAIGIFSAFIDEPNTKLYGVEAGGLGIDTDFHAATLTKGSPGIIHGMKTFVLQDKYGRIDEVHSISAGLDYPGVGPEHSHLFDIKRAQYFPVTDKEAMDALILTTRREGIIPALESAHALAFLEKLCPTLSKEKRETIIVNVSGRGDKDMHTIFDTLKKEGVENAK